MRALLHLSLLSLTLVLLGVFGVDKAWAQTSGIPPFDGPPITQAQLYALGDTCASDPDATKRRGALGSGRGDGIKDTCSVEDTETVLFCSYSSEGGQYREAVYCTITYKNQPEPNVRRIDVNVLAGGGDGTDEDVTTPDVAGGSTSVPPPAGTCSPLNLDVCIRNLPGMLFAGLAFLFLTLSSAILWLAGTVFNWVVIRTVFQFGTYFGTSDGMLLAWGIMRDVANIGLLFGFILMGVLLILNVDGGGHGHGHGGGISAKKAIPRLIIFAVLLNFSLFASQFVIDVSNAFSASFATLAGERCATTTSNGASTAGGQELEDCANIGIAGQVLQVAGVNKIWVFGESSDEAFKNLVDRPYSYTVSLMLLSIFVLVTAMVLFAGAIMLVVRVVVLTLLMITSPIGFAGMAIPKLQGIASMWWDKLISQSFFAPVYLLLIFMSVKLSEGLMQGNASLASALIASEGNTVAGNMQVAMVFMVVIGLMIASLVAASKMGAMGSKFATSSAAALTVGSVGFVGRRTIGVTSGKVANRIASSTWAQNNGFGSRFAYGIANKGASASYSLRTGLNTATKGVGADTGMGAAGKNVSHGIHGIEEAEVKKRVEFAEKTLKQTKEQKAEEERLKKAKTAVENSKSIEVARWKSRKSAEQVAIDQQAKINDADIAAREARIEAQRAVVAQADANKTANPARAAQEKRVLDDMVTNHVELSKKEKSDLEARRQAFAAEKSQHEQNVAGFDARIKQIDKEIKGGEFFNPETGKTDVYVGVSADAARRTYAKSMEHSGLSWPSVGKHINHESAEKILKKLNRSQNEKLIDAIKETAKESAKEGKDDHGGDDHGKKDDHGGGGGHGGGHEGGGGHH